MNQPSFSPLGAPQSSKTYVNPVSFGEGDLPTNADPFVMKYLGEYYCYSTGGQGVQVSRSADLVSWEHLGFAFQEPTRNSYWAPCVVYRNGLFYMYVSDRPLGEEDPHEQHMRVATSSTPEGPFTSVRVMKDSFSIDADVLIDQDGEAFMFYASNEFTSMDLEHPGTSIVVDHMPDMLHLAGNPRPVVVPTLAEEVFAENRFGDGRDWHTIEGAAYFERRGLAYMTYSGNAYERENYFIGYSRATKDVAIGDLAWSKVPNDYTFNPLMRRNDAVEGTGHNSVIQAPNLVDWWIIYHGRDAAQEIELGREQRVMRIDRLWFDGQMMCADAPSSTARDVPRQPTMGGSAVSGDLAAQWEITAGTVNRQGKALVSGRDRHVEALSRAQVGPYVAEIDVQLADGAREGRYGLVPIYLTSDEQIAIWFDAGARTIEARAMVGGIWTQVAVAPLKDFEFSAWQPLRIERSLTEVVVKRGYQVLIRFAHTYGAAKARVGICSQSTAMAVGSFGLTEHLDWYPLPDDEFGTVAEIGHVLRANRPLQATSSGLTWRERSTATVQLHEPLENGEELTLDFSLIAPYGEVTVAVSGYEDEWPSVVITTEQIRWQVPSGDIVPGIPRNNEQTTVRLLVQHKSLLIVVGDQVCSLPTPAASSFSPTASLSGATLRGLSRTRSTHIFTK